MTLVWSRKYSNNSIIGMSLTIVNNLISVNSSTFTTYYKAMRCVAHMFPYVNGVEVGDERITDFRWIFFKFN